MSNKENEQITEPRVEKVTQPLLEPVNKPMSDEALVLELVLLIIKNIGIKNLNMEISPLDGHISFNASLPWVKNLVDKVLPLYKQLKSDPNIKTDATILEMVEVMNKSSVSNDILDIISLQSGKLDIEHITEVTKLVTNLASLYQDISKTNITIKNTLTQQNVMTLLTIVLYIILFLIRKNELGEKDIQWIEITINCLKFTSTLLLTNKKFSISSLFSCCKFK